VELEQVEVLASGLAFPEGPVAMADGSIVFVEIAGGRVSRLAPSGAVTVVAETGGGPNGAAVGPDGALYVCNNGGMGEGPRSQAGIQRVDLATGAVTWLYTACDGRPLVSPNDLVFDAAGGFWFTDLAGGTIHYASPDGTSVRCVLRGLHQPNGIGLSPEGDVLYWAQTVSRQVLRRRVTGPGTLAPSPGYDVLALLRRGGLDPWTLLVGLGGGQQLDSLAIDAEGAVCVGTLVESGVTRASPTGRA